VKIRELLQYEIWSKSTTRKILARKGKALGRVGIVLGILVVALGVVYVVEISWMTSGERKAATTALAEIDALQNYVAAGGNDFDARDQKANETAKAAARAAWTIRDNQAAFELWEYLSSTENDRMLARLRAKGRADMQKRNIPLNLHPALSEENDMQETQMRLSFRSAVLKALQ